MVHVQVGQEDLVDIIQRNTQGIDTLHRAGAHIKYKVRMCSTLQSVELIMVIVFQGTFCQNISVQDTVGLSHFF